MFDWVGSVSAVVCVSIFTIAMVVLGNRIHDNFGTVLFLFLALQSALQQKGKRR